MYRTLIKSNSTIINDQDAVVIDTNALIAQKLEMLSAKCIQKAEDSERSVNELFQDPDAERVAALLDDRDDHSGAGFSEGIAAKSDIIKAEPVYQGPSPEELIAQAQQEIAQIKQDAVKEIEQAKREAVEAGRKEGYDAGYRKGMQETEQLKKELEEKAATVEKDYERKIEELEPHFIETLTGIYEHVLNISLADETQLIMFLAGNALRDIEGSKNFLIHVSKEDYPVVCMQKKQLLAVAGNSNASLEVIADATMTKNSCMIETEGGIFDCGLGTQLEELSKQLKLLSYTEDVRR